MPKVSEEYIAAKKQQILEAAIVCFARNGFVGTTIQDVCQEARISHGALYRYFRSKDEIVEATCRAQGEGRKARYAALLQQHSARKVLATYLAQYFRRRSQPEPESLIKFQVQLYGEAVRTHRIGEIQRKGREELLELAAEVVRGGQERGEISSSVDALAVARTVGAIADGFLIQKSDTPDLDVAKCFEAVSAIFFGNLWLNDKEGGLDGKHK